jgi:hypothetical protein
MKKTYGKLAVKFVPLGNRLRARQKRIKMRLIFSLWLAYKRQLWDNMDYMTLYGLWCETSCGMGKKTIRQVGG